jgi:hypothetical protein
MTNSIKQYLALRTALESERAALQKRLQEINAALGVAMAAEQMANNRTGGPVRLDTRGASLTMREAIAEVVKDSPKRIRQIVEEMTAMGYSFTTKNPINSVGAFLYGPGKKHFKGSEGLFTNKR